MSASFRRLAKIDAQILRGAAVVDGKRADAGTVIASLRITPFTSASAEVVQRTVTEAPTKLLTTYCEGPADGPGRRRVEGGRPRIPYQGLLSLRWLWG